jgi:hypothetical protein
VSLCVFRVQLNPINEAISDNYFGMSVGEKAQSDLEFINSDKSDGLSNKHLFHYAEIIDINSSLVKTDAFIEKSTQVHGNKYDYFG